MPIGEAARRIGCSIDTLRDWAKAGKFPAIVTPGGRYRFRQADIDAFLGRSA